jgi:hypothetical protein
VDPDADWESRSGLWNAELSPKIKKLGNVMFKKLFFKLQAL